MHLESTEMIPTDSVNVPLYPLLEGSFWGKLAPITYKETMDCASFYLD